MSHASHSQYALYKKCQHQYKLNYIDKIGDNYQNIHLLFGTSLHEVLQLYVKTMFNITQKSADELNLESYLMDRLKFNFRKSLKDLLPNQYPCTSEELTEFYNDGVNILTWFKKRTNRLKFFSKKGYKLVGIELPLNVELKKGVQFTGYLDIVLEHDDGDVIIIDLKSSTAGWRSYVKNDKIKTNQILLYKKLYSDKHNIPLNKIKPEFQIYKRKISEDFEFPIPRVSRFVPAHGKPSINNAWNDFMQFVDEVYDDDGKRKTDRLYLKNPGMSNKNCKYCPFDSICDKINVENKAVSPIVLYI